MTTLQQLSASQVSPEVPINENIETLSAAGIYGKRHPATTGLTWAYYGGLYNGNTIANGTVTLTNAADNYVVVLRSTGVVSTSTSSANSLNPLYAKLYKVTCAGGVVTAVVDQRWDDNGLLFSTGGVSRLDAMEDTDLLGSPSPQHGDVLTWNAATQKWVAGDPDVLGGATALSELTDVQVAGSPGPVDGQVLTWSNSLQAWIASTPGSGTGTKTYAVFSPMNSNPPASNYATLDTRNSIAVLDFDDTTEEGAFWVGIMPEGASLGSGLKVSLTWMSTSATSGNVRWGAKFERLNTDTDSDSFDTAFEGHTATSGTSGTPVKTTITCTSIDGITAQDAYRLWIYRDASDGVNDTVTGDAELIAVEVWSAA